MAAKPWQIAVIAGGLLLGGGLLVWQTMGTTAEDAHMTKTVMLVDVTSGQIYKADTRKGGVLFPARSPETGKRALLPVHKDDSGKWVVSPRYLDILQQVEAENKVVDAKTGDLQQASSDVREYVKPSK